MVLIIDNYDSFVYNLARYVEELNYKTFVVRNDKITLDDIIEKYKPSHIIISPGPCTPNEAGISLDLVKSLAGIIPILGVCLGHQVIGQAFGAKILEAQVPMHGMSAALKHSGEAMFKGVASPSVVARYHSLIVDATTLPPELEVCAYSEEGEIMAMNHKKMLVWGVQFHPESVLTAAGYDILINFLRMKNAKYS
ncbi:MAG: aminodeoxychorismate/anthranilate synthase component II [Legionellales bacterium]|nr:aminodeoxychorismate/anthranilate synthase component II [Legionellales bacterium]